MVADGTELSAMIRSSDGTAVLHRNIFVELDAIDRETNLESCHGMIDVGYIMRYPRYTRYWHCLVTSILCWRRKVVELAEASVAGP